MQRPALGVKQQEQNTDSTFPVSRKKKWKGIHVPHVHVVTSVLGTLFSPIWEYNSELNFSNTLGFTGF